MKFRWSLCPPHPLLAAQLAAELSIPRLLAQCLVNRELTEAQSISKFLDPRLKHLADPFLLPDLREAVERLLMARERCEELMIFGDYDVDGVASTALLLNVLQDLGWRARHYLPSRRDEGYGLTQAGADHCLERYPSTLVLAVDCGSTAVDTIASLHARGVDVIVLDHHQVGTTAPACVALVNPHRRDALSTAAGSAEIGKAPRFAELCSAGLAFKLAHALVKRGRNAGWPEAAAYDVRQDLDLVALATVADVAPLVGENRILVSAGLDRLGRSQRPGLVALRSVAQCPPSIGVYEAGFQLAPRLNAAGRLETAEDALRLLLTRDATEAAALARRLDERNRERQGIEKRMFEEVRNRVEGRFNSGTDYVIVEGDPAWHIGVVGIVASRVLQQFYRPTIIAGGGGDCWRGSGRSIPGFDMAAALRECGDLLMRHGGHALAAGISIQPERMDKFRARFNEVARRSIKKDDLEPELKLDAEVCLEELDEACVSGLGRLRPIGQGNPGVQLLARNLVHSRPLQRIGADKQHVKMWLTSDGRETREALWWGAGNEALPVGSFDLAFVPQLNMYQGRSTIQLKVLDWRPAAEAAGGTRDLGI